MSVYADILTQFRQQTIQYVDLSGEGKVPGLSGALKEASVRIWFGPGRVGTDRKDLLKTAPMPGVLFTPRRAVRRSPGEGYNSEDYDHYDVLCQIVDNSEERDNLDFIRTWTRWEQNLSWHFHNQNLRLKVFNEEGYCNIVYSPETDVSDDRMWDVHSRMVMAIVFDVPVLHRRPPEGSV